MSVPASQHFLHMPHWILQTAHALSLPTGLGVSISGFWDTLSMALEIISLSTVKMACRCYIGRESLHSLSTNLAYLVLQSPQDDPSRDSEATPSARLHIFQFNVQQQVLNVIQHGVWLHIYGSGFGVRVWPSGFDINYSLLAHWWWLVSCMMSSVDTILEQGGMKMMLCHICYTPVQSKPSQKGHICNTMMSWCIHVKHLMAQQLPLGCFWKCKHRSLGPVDKIKVVIRHLSSPV